MSIFLPIVITILFIQNDDAVFRKEHYNLDEKKLAIQGYDPVSYFSDAGPQKGDKKINYSYEGVIYYFISNENKNKFIEIPQTFGASYGGWCAYALGNSGENCKGRSRNF